ncbi:MAG: TetR/AcrR family transcriptional regulator, partial [Saprospiraceae bacterium]
MVRNSTKEKIFEEAAILFRDKGYLATTMRELAAKVDLQVSSLYSHIGGKEEILHKICFDNARRFLEGLKRVEALRLTPTQKVEQLISEQIRIATTDVTSVTIFNDEWRHLSEPYLGEFLRMRKDYERRFIKIIQEGIEAGEFVKIDATVALFTLLTSLRWLHRWYPSRKGISVKSLEREILKIIF